MFDLRSILLSTSFGVLAASCALGFTAAYAHDLTGLSRRPMPQDIDGLQIVQRSCASPSERRKYQKRCISAPAVPSNTLAEFKQIVNMRPEGIAYLSRNKYLWPHHHDLSVCFWDGEPAARTKTLAVLQSILDFTTLQIDMQRAKEDCVLTQRSATRLDGVRDIMIRFATVGCASYIGKVGRTKVRPGKETDHTVQLCGNTNPDSKFQRRVILHEFMHALGVLHEHQHPGSTCEVEFDLDRLEAEFGADVVSNNFRAITQRPGINRLLLTGYDRASIMHYRIKQIYFDPDKPDECHLRDVNVVLSNGDKAILKRLYPKSGES